MHPHLRKKKDGAALCFSLPWPLHDASLIVALEFISFDTLDVEGGPQLEVGCLDRLCGIWDDLKADSEAAGSQCLYVSMYKHNSRRA